MNIFDIMGTGYFGLSGLIAGPAWEQLLSPAPAPDTTKDTLQGVATARLQLLLATAAITAIVAAPAIYSASKGKRVLKTRETRQGVALENASAQATGLLMTALSAPAISTAAAYIGVQKLEDAHIISRGLGNAAQGLLTVAAAGPAIAGIGQVATSAFLKGK